LIPAAYSDLLSRSIPISRMPLEVAHFRTDCGNEGSGTDCRRCVSGLPAFRRAFREWIPLPIRSRREGGNDAAWPSFPNPRREWTTSTAFPNGLQETPLWRTPPTAPPPQSQRRAGSLRVVDARRAAPPRAGDRTVGRWSRLWASGSVQSPGCAAERIGQRRRRMAEWASDRRTCGSRSVDPDCGRCEVCEIKERR
jgi:hypothetical protein